MKAHRHKAIQAHSKDYGWTTCVTPAECAARPERQDAHGNIVIVDVCSCGATRQAESNGGRVNFGPWSGEEVE